MKRVIEALERKHPGSKVTYVHLGGPVLGWDNVNKEEMILGSDDLDELAKAIDEAEPMDISELN